MKAGTRVGGERDGNDGVVTGTPFILADALDDTTQSAEAKIAVDWAGDGSAVELSLPGKPPLALSTDATVQQFLNWGAQPLYKINRVPDPNSTLCALKAFGVVTFVPCTPATVTSGNQAILSGSEDNLWKEVWERSQFQISQCLDLKTPRRSILEDIGLHMSSAAGTTMILDLWGVRRSGKTHLIYQCINELLMQDVPSNLIFYLDFTTLRSLAEDRLLYLLQKAFQNGAVLFFIDEIQLVPQWENQLRCFHDLASVSSVWIVITGSQAGLITGNLPLALTGRHIPMQILPLSFNEFVTHQLAICPTVGVQFLWERYCDFGGLPFVAIQPVGDEAGNPSTWYCENGKTVASALYDDLLSKDCGDLVNSRYPRNILDLVKGVLSGPALLIHQNLRGKCTKAIRRLLSVCFFFEVEVESSDEPAYFPVDPVLYQLPVTEPNGRPKSLRQLGILCSLLKPLGKHLVVGKTSSDVYFAKLNRTWLFYLVSNDEDVESVKAHSATNQFPYCSLLSINNDFSNPSVTPLYQFLRNGKAINLMASNLETAPFSGKIKSVVPSFPLSPFQLRGLLKLHIREELSKITKN